MLRMLLAVSALVLQLHYATAQQPGPGIDPYDPGIDEIFQIMDQNNDGVITAEEMNKASDEGDGDAQDAFKMMDADGDGTATRAEVAEFARKMGTHDEL
jgi:hypothetical protein